MADIVDKTLLQALLPDFSSYRNPVAFHDSGNEQATTQPQVEDKPTQKCSIRDFVKAIALPTSMKLYQNWFSVSEVVAGVKEHGYTLSADTALEYLTYLVQRGDFLIRGEGDTAQYKKTRFTYAMDFWDSPT